MKLRSNRCLSSSPIKPEALLQEILVIMGSSTVETRFPEAQSSIYDFEAKRIDGKVESFEKYRGNWLLFVNVASQCGFTSQYTGLEKLYQDFRERGLIVLGFPCNQFMGQEPSSDADIQTFCSTRYQVTFPMFSKIEVNGPKTAPVYQFLKKRGRTWLGFQRIGWNFTKFLVHADGKTVERFGTTTTPATIAERLTAILGEKQ